MNVSSPVSGFAGILKSLNGDRAYGWSLLGVCLALVALAAAGEAVSTALQYDRAAIAGGQWWRLLGAHLVHLDMQHALLNALGLVLMWALFARDFTVQRWAIILLAAALTIGAGLWIFSPQIAWYVGASGVLHGVMAAGTLAHLRRGDLDGWILAPFIVLKLAYEQYAGALPFAGTADTIVDAHLYGAIGGLCAALLLASRRESA